MNALVPLGDQGALAYFAIEADALRFADAVRQANEVWLVDVVSAYASVAVYFDLRQSDFVAVRDRLQQIEQEAGAKHTPLAGRLHEIPCCYERGPDLARVAEKTGLVPEEVIRLHAATEYVVYAIGFCPGFPYLGYLPPELSGVPRLESPRLRVDAGSVGMTGRQTGIYTEPRPGGWNLIGQTPLELVHVADGYFPLRAGDRVRFVRVDEAEYQRRRGERLSSPLSPCTQGERGEILLPSPLVLRGRGVGGEGF
jgi:inhibitor of KinA